MGIIYNPVELKPGQTQYGTKTFDSNTIYPAKYRKSIFYPDNPVLGAIPPRPSEKELYDEITNSIPFDFKRLVAENQNDKPLILDAIHYVKNSVRLYLPNMFRVSNEIHNSLMSSYSRRKINYAYDFSIGQDSLVPRFIPIDRGDAACGSYVLGESGTGKSTAVELGLRFIPQVLEHPLDGDGELKQIVYIKVDCKKDGFKQIIQSIGAEIDTALHNPFQTHQKMLAANARRSQADQELVLAQLINAFGIGLLIFDESQELRYDSAYNRSITNLLNLSNTTKCAIMFVGTHYFNGYENAVEDTTKGVRRVGGDVKFDDYCHDDFTFDSILHTITQYSVFPPDVDFRNDPVLKAAFETYSDGNIDAITTIWEDISAAYVEMDNKPIVDKSFIEWVIQNRCFHRNDLVAKKIAKRWYAFEDRVNNIFAKNQSTEEDAVLIPNQRQMLEALKTVCQKVKQNFEMMENVSYEEDVLEKAIQEACLQQLRKEKPDIQEKSIQSATQKLLDKKYKPKTKKRPTAVSLPSAIPGIPSSTTPEIL